MRGTLLCTFFFVHLGVLGQFTLQEPFDECGVTGSITIYDVQRKLWMTNDIKDSQHATLPASTFKIVNSLIAFETGTVRDEYEIIPWIDDYDTLRYGNRPEIYRDMNLEDAFKQSAVWVYVEVAKKIGKERYRDWLTRIGYGNVDVSIDDPDFWNFGDMAISPVNQIEILKGIYEEIFPFSKRSYALLKKMMIAEKTEDYTIWAKTGWTGKDGKDIGWWVGYVERGGDLYFFATRLTKDRSESNPRFGSCRKEITKKVFKELGLL
ncbi:MAG: penicillin-binding transpeptidase domain-containing protein [Bacteroidota bacterium]